MDADFWLNAKNEQLASQEKLIEQLVEEREKLHETHLEELLAEETRLGSNLLQIEGRYFVLPNDVTIANDIYSSLARIADQRRQLELNLWKDKSHFRQLLAEVQEQKTRESWR